MKFEIALNPLDCVSAVNVEENAERVLPEEHQLTIFVNEIETYRVICTPTLLPELVLLLVQELLQLVLLLLELRLWMRLLQRLQSKQCH